MRTFRALLGVMSMATLLTWSLEAIGRGAPYPSWFYVVVLDSQSREPIQDLVATYDGSRPLPFKQTLTERLQHTWWVATHPKVWGKKPNYWRSASDTIKGGPNGILTVVTDGPTWLKIEAPGYQARRIRSPEDYHDEEQHPQRGCCNCPPDTLWMSRTRY
jgi:hypothetical protein